MDHKSKKFSYCRATLEGNRKKLQHHSDGQLPEQLHLHDGEKPAEKDSETSAAFNIHLIFIFK